MMMVVVSMPMQRSAKRFQGLRQALVSFFQVPGRLSYKCSSLRLTRRTDNFRPLAKFSPVALIVFKPMGQQHLQFFNIR